MREELRSKVEGFFDWFEEQLGRIANIDGESGELFKKTLYVNLIDAVSVSVFPRKDSNRDRFVSAVTTFAPRAYWSKVSIPHLHRLLRIVPAPAFEQLRQEVNSTLSKWHASEGLIPISHDLDVGDIKRKWPEAAQLKLPDTSVSLESLTHAHLLWTYRNQLVHEFRSPGYGMELTHDEEPYYQWMPWISATNGPDSGDETLELVYPVRFLHGVCKSILTSLREHFMRKELDPYESYTFSSYWLKELG